MSSPVTSFQPPNLPPQAFGCGVTSQAQKSGAAFGRGAPVGDTVQFSGTREENQKLLDATRARHEEGRPVRNKKEKKGSVGAGFGKSVKYGCGATALSFLTGLALLAAAPFSIGLSAIPGIALMVGCPFVGFLGATIGFLKGKAVG